MWGLVSHLNGKAKIWISMEKKRNIVTELQRCNNSMIFIKDTRVYGNEKMLSTNSSDIFMCPSSYATSTVISAKANKNIIK